MNNPRWKQRPKGSTWGDWGINDQVGRLNLVDQEKVRQGIAEVLVGKTFCLSLPLNYPGGQVLNKVRHPPVLKPVIRNGEPYFNYSWNKMDANNSDIGSDDAVLLYTQYSTQWDGLAHRGALFDINGTGVEEAVYYNGFKANKDIVINADSSSEASSLGIENMAYHGVQGRGVLVDLFSDFGEKPSKSVGYDDLMRIFEKQNICIESGDILCLWTGLDQMIMRMNGKPDSSIIDACSSLDGHDKKLQAWIRESGVAAIVSDNLAVETLGVKIPNGSCSNLPLHRLCLFELGIHLGELWLLCDLANWLKEHNRSKFLLTAPPLRLPGAVGSPVTPIATV